MEVLLAILLAALVGGVVFMLLERWQRSPAQPTLADHPVETHRADLDPAAADVLVLVAALARGRDPSAPARAGVGTRARAAPRDAPAVDAAARAAPAGTGTTTTATGTRTTTIVRPASGPGWANR